MIERPIRTVQGGGGASDGVSVVLPAFNLEPVICNTVAVLREELQPIAPALEFIVVDDGSTDGTAAAVARLCEIAPDVRLLRNRRNLGKGVAVYLGLLAAKYSNACFTDADLPFAPGSYARVVQQLLLGTRFAAASRRMPDSEILVRMEVLGYAARRHLVGVAFNHLVRGSLGLPFHDTQCGLKAFERRVGIELFRRVRSPGFLFDIELFLVAGEMGIQAAEVPVCVVYNDFKSSVKLLADSTRMLFGLAMIWMRYHLGRYRVENPAMAPDVVRTWAEEVLPAGRAGQREPAVAAMATER